MKSARFLLPATALLLLASCAKHATPETTSAAASLPPARVHAVAVHTENLVSYTDATGTVRPVQRAQIAAKLMGTIEEMPVTLGQAVHAGDVLLKISVAEINARLAQAQSQLNVAQRDLARERDLLTKGASTADMVRGLEDRFTMTQAMVREAEIMLGYATIRAPFDGVVARKLVNPGDLAAPGMPLLELEGTVDFQVEAALPDSLAVRLTTGAQLSVSVPVSGLTFTGTLAELSSAADSGARTVLAKITVPAGTAVRSGEFARVQLPGEAVSALLAPAAAVTVLGQMERVFVVTPAGTAALRLVKTGSVRGDRIEILAGLDSGERVVVAPPAGLLEGQRLEVQP